MTSIEELKKQGELAGLQGDSAQALAFFEQALIQAIKQNNDDEMLNCIANIAIIYKHQYHALSPEDPQRIPFIEMMGANAMAGVRIAEAKNLSGQPKSAALLRVGDYYYALGNFQKAADTYNSALTEIKNYAGEDAEQMRAEYLGHYGQALGMIDDKQGIKKLQEALNLTENLSDAQIRPFHKLIITSGILMRMAEVYWSADDKENAKKVLEQAKPQTEKLANEFQMPDRLEQLNKFFKEL